MTLALDFKSATLYAVRIVLHEADTGSLREALAQRMADAGSFFENEPVVIDASRIEAAVDWPALLDALREHNLPPIGVVAEGDNLDAARRAGLVPVELPVAVARPPAAPTVVSTSEPVPTPAVASADAPAAGEGGNGPDGADAGPEADEAGDSSRSAAEASGPADPSASPGAAASPGPATEPAPPPTAMVINRPLRSGQRVYARQGDLIVIGMVSQGAEVIADGNVHVYGPLRGKAMAGARGDVSARIFTTQLDAELLAVAGVYRVVEDKLGADLHNRPALVSLDGETLRIEALKA